MKKLRKLIAVISISLVCLFGIFGTNVAHADICVNNNSTHWAYRMTSFSVNTGVYPITLTSSNVPFLLYGFYDTYFGPTAVVWVKSYYTNYNVGGNILVMVDSRYVTTAYYCTGVPA